MQLMQVLQPLLVLRDADAARALLLVVIVAAATGRGGAVLVLEELDEAGRPDAVGRGGG